MKNIKKSAVDLTDLAIGIVVLGIVVSVGSTILLSVRDSRLTDLSTNAYTQSVSATDAGTGLTNKWFKDVSSVVNATGGETVLATGNYTTSVDAFGTGTITFDGASPYNGTDVNVTYNAYDTSRADYDLADSSAIGLAEYGNWFKIIVIVGVAAVILALIFMAFGGRNSSGSMAY